MPSTPLPGVDIWALYPELGIIILIMAVLMGGVFFLWKQFTSWSEKQDEKRDAERERTREWQGKQDEKRDAGYQTLIRELQSRHEADSAADRDKLTELTEVIRRLVEQVTGLNQSLSEHISDENARRGEPVRTTRRAR